MILGIYGSGGAGCELREIAELQNVWKKLVFIDDTVKEDIYKGVVRVPFERFSQTFGTKNAKIIIAQGEPEYKFTLYNKVKKKGYSLANLIHPNAYVSRSAKIGEGIVVQANACISCNVIISDNVHILPGAIIMHDCIIHKHCQISPGAVLGGGTEIGERTYIGLNASIRDKIKIGEDTVIGMGATVLKDIPNNIIAFGTPAKEIENKNNKKIFNKI